VKVATNEGEGGNLTCGESSWGECWMEKHAENGYAGESGKAPGRLRIDLEAALCNVPRVGETIPFIKID